MSRNILMTQDTQGEGVLTFSQGGHPRTYVILYSTGSKADDGQVPKGGKLLGHYFSQGMENEKNMTEQLGVSSKSESGLKDQTSLLSGIADSGNSSGQSTFPVLWCQIQVDS